MNIVTEIKRQGQQAATTVRQAFRGRLTALDTKKPVQLMQLEGLNGEKIQAAEFFQHFGFSSAPPDGTQCIILPLSGKTVHSIIIATENGPLRVALEQGEACVYNAWGAKITLKKDNLIEVIGKNLVAQIEQSAKIVAGQEITAQAPQINLVGNITSTGQGGGIGQSQDKSHRQHEGSYELTGPQTVNGAVRINGSLVVTGGITGKVNGCQGCGE